MKKIWVQMCGPCDSITRIFSAGAAIHENQVTEALLWDPYMRENDLSVDEGQRAIFLFPCTRYLATIPGG